MRDAIANTFILISFCIGVGFLFVLCYIGIIFINPKLNDFNDSITVDQPCEYYANYTINYIPVRCIDYWWNNEQ